jgi:hypothetical protein
VAGIRLKQKNFGRMGIFLPVKSNSYASKQPFPEKILPE